MMANPSEATLDVNGQAINPVSRDYPDEFIQTRSFCRLTAEHSCSWIKVQYSRFRLPHKELAAQIAVKTVLNSDSSR